MQCKTCDKELTLPYQKIYCSKSCKFNDLKELSYNNRQNIGTYRRIYFIRLLGNKCSLCGYSKNITALEFHHIKDKSFNLDLRALSNFCFQKLLDETSKCILLCSNCHRETHNNLDKFILDNYLEISSDELLSKSRFKPKPKKYCSLCNEIMNHSSKGNICKNCLSSNPIYKERPNARKVIRPSKEILKEEITQFSFTRLGEKYNVSDNAVRQWCKLYNLDLSDSKHHRNRKR